MKKISLSAFMLIATLAVFPLSVQAAPIGFDFGDGTTSPVIMNFGTNLGIPGNYEGIIDISMPSPRSGFKQYADVTTTLAGNTKIVFTYTFSEPVGPFVDGKSNGDYRYILSKDITPANTPVWEQDLSNPDQFVYTLAISNFLSSNLTFDAYLKLNDYIGGIEARYETSSLSAVPFPAALPLFALGLAGLTGYARVKKNKAAV